MQILVTQFSCLIRKKANSGKIRVKAEPKETRSLGNTDVMGGNATAEDVAEGDVGNQNEGEGLSKEESFEAELTVH